MDADLGDFSQFADKEEDLGFSESNQDIPTRGNRSSPLEGLSNVDYSLNSALLPDEIDEFILFLRNKSYRKSWNQRLWKERGSLCKYLDINPSKIKPTSRFHQEFAQLLLRQRYNTVLIQKLIDNANDDHKLTWEIPNSFFKSWVKKDLRAPDKSCLSPSTFNYGALWLEFHFITLLLNASSFKELKALCTKLKANIIEDKGQRAVTMTLPNLGTVHCIKGLAYFVNLEILADRNMVLMMKDTTNARFQSLMSLQNRVDDTYSLDCLRDLEEVYKIGDEMLLEAGNKAYDGLKMIEPMCNLRLTQLAQLHRPKIPLNPAFGNHINDAIESDHLNHGALRRLLRKLNRITDENSILNIYGSYRHWGHPFLEYMEGLKKLNKQTTLPKRIDKNYATKLASDLTFIVLKDQFGKHKKWFVNHEALPDGHKLKETIAENTWPTPFQIKDFGDEWHTLPLTPCFEIPDMIDPSQIYSDKSHSLNRSEIIAHIKEHPGIPIPSKKVLTTFINQPATDWAKFLKEINDHGLSLDDLVIGLRGKEREVKRIGRFFALMSWRLRDYFVITEYLIKLHYVPLFAGLTMADDLNTVVKKMLDTANGQGLDTYDYITIANHIDYEKWNNHQRGDANNPVFEVMGIFLGLPNLFVRTHEFFEKSLIYYNYRADLMYVDSAGVVQNKDPNDPVCWNGQAGGLEGLRQKGWSIVNLLVIRREGKAENTRLSILAQGDNQVVCTQYKLQKTRTNDELEACIHRVLANNDKIMKNIERGTTRLGLLINQDETIQSADYLNYGKVPIFRGRIKGLETKRWSRFACVSNDQLPTLANIMTTVSSNALSVSHFSDSPLNPIAHYNFLGNFTLRVLDLHNPATRCDVKSLLPPADRLDYNSKEFKIIALYLDPSLGGVCGTSLTRFLIRSFPDPITESLSFWKGIYEGVSESIQKLICVIGSPKLSSYNRGAFAKLLENPLSLNIRHGINPVQLIKDEIKANLIKDHDSIKNLIVKNAVRHSRDEEESLYAFLESIRPRFPRFLSEYKAATYLGLTESLVGLFQNSKTIRNVFSRRLKRRIDEIIVTSELKGVEHMVEIVKRARVSGVELWRCSSSRADQLRALSWGCIIVGATVPHPFEMTKDFEVGSRCNYEGVDNPAEAAHLSVLVPKGIPKKESKKGPYKPYLGSKTMETTSVLRPWENDIRIPLIKRAADLRKAFNWFVRPDSNLGHSILNNLQALTGEDWIEDGIQARRTGSALHRFSCSRQSQGGFIAQSPSCGSWMIETTDTMNDLGDQNYDFLFQALLLYGQITIGEHHHGTLTSGFYHFHIQCQDCLRPVFDIELDSAYEYQHPEVWEILNSWKPETSTWIEKRPRIFLPEGHWDPLSNEEKSFHIGKMQGFLLGELIYHSKRFKDDSSLFPLATKDRLDPHDYLHGLLYGLLHASALGCLYKRSVQELRRPQALLYGQALFLIDQLMKNEGLLNICRSDNFMAELITVPHRIPPSYPLTNSELGLLGRNYMRSLFTDVQETFRHLPPRYDDVWIFGDCVDPDVIIPFVLSKDALNLMYMSRLSPADIPAIKGIKDILGADNSEVQGQQVQNILNLRHAYLVGQEIRHAVKGMRPVPQINLRMEAELQRQWGVEYSGDIHSIRINYEIEPEELSGQPNVPCRQDPLISGLRLFQCPTGAHYKIRSIIEKKKIDFTDFLVGGDGSGGMTSALLRMNRNSRAIFNSLLDLKDVELKGSSPSPPSALSCTPEVRDRCVNYHDVWKNPTDLTMDETWEYFLNLKNHFRLQLDLLVFDVETLESGSLNQIELLLSKYAGSLLGRRGTVIFKTHFGILAETWKAGLLTWLGPNFRTVELITTEISSSHTSEVYILMRHPHIRNINCQPAILSVLRELHKIPVFRSREDEFFRALHVPTERMFDGVPPELIPAAETELCVLLISIGVETGVSALIAELLRQCTYENMRVMPFYILFLSLNSLFYITRGDKSSSIPTDSTVYNWGGFLTGFLIWLGWNRGRFIIKENAQHYIDNQFLFSWKYNTAVKTGLKFRNLSFLGVFNKDEKNVYLDSKMALIGSTIRVFARLFPRNFKIKFDTELVDELLQEHNKYLSVHRIESTTDLRVLLTAKPIRFPRKPAYINVENLHAREGAWRRDN